MRHAAHNESNTSAATERSEPSQGRSKLKYLPAPTSVLSMKRLGTLSVSIIVLLVAACHEDRNARYETAADAKSDGAFDRGWLPEALFPDTWDIHESHNLDTNHGEATFRYRVKLQDGLARDCSSTLSSQTVDSPFRAWPANQTAGQLTSRGITVFNCGTFTLALDSGKQLGYLWH